MADTCVRPGALRLERERTCLQLDLERWQLANENHPGLYDADVLQAEAALAALDTGESR